MRIGNGWLPASREMAGLLGLSGGYPLFLIRYRIKSIRFLIGASMIKLNVPYHQKDEAKALGARWVHGVWVVPNGKSWRKFAGWLTAGQVEQLENEAAFKKSKQAMRKTNGAALLGLLSGR